MFSADGRLICDLCRECIEISKTQPRQPVWIRRMRGNASGVGAYHINCADQGRSELQAEDDYIADGPPARDELDRLLAMGRRAARNLEVRTSSQSNAEASTPSGSNEGVPAAGCQPISSTASASNEAVTSPGGQPNTSTVSGSDEANTPSGWQPNTSTASGSDEAVPLRRSARLRKRYGRD